MSSRMRAGGVGFVHGKLAGQAVAHVIFGQQMCAARACISGSFCCTHRILGAVKPVRASLPVISIRRRLPSRRGSRRTARRCAGRSTGWPGAALAGLVQQGQAVHLPGQANALHVRAGNAGLLQHLADAAARPRSTSRPGPARSTAGQLAVGAAGDGAVWVDQQGFYAGRAHVNTKIVGHVAPRARVQFSGKRQERLYTRFARQLSSIIFTAGAARSQNAQSTFSNQPAAAGVLSQQFAGWRTQSVKYSQRIACHTPARRGLP
jgi:hypothetical protein